MSGTYVLAAGGTGGHLFPAQSLARELMARGREVVVMTDRRGRAYGGFPGARMVSVPSASFTGRSPFRLGLAALTIAFGVMSAFVKLVRLRPRAVVGFGGYPSLPVMLAAFLAGRPSVLHEQNAVPGRVNRLIARHVTRIAATFPFARFVPRCPERVVFTGNPVRAEVAALAGGVYHAQEQGEVYLLVFGGSQGAHVLSTLVPAALARLPTEVRARLKIAQQARAEDVEAVRAAYSEAGIAAEVAPFFSDLPARMAFAHLVIARAGASTLSELAVIGRPSVLIPYPYAMDDHQSANAAIFANAGAALVLVQSTLTAEHLGDTLASLLAAPRRLNDMALAASRLANPRAVEDLADLVESVGA